MGERLIPAVLKTVVPERVPGVRIPLPPPGNVVVGVFPKGEKILVSRLCLRFISAQDECSARLQMRQRTDGAGGDNSTVMVGSDSPAFLLNLPASWFRGFRISSLFSASTCSSSRTLPVWQCVMPAL
jgi:hypothetical protein